MRYPADKGEGEQREASCILVKRRFEDDLSMMHSEISCRLANC